MSGSDPSMAPVVDSDAAAAHGSSTSDDQRRRRRRRVGLVLAAAALFGLSFHLLVATETFWITDGGNRFLQVQSFAEHGGAPQLELPGAELDPQGLLLPRGGHHFEVEGRRLTSFYPPFWALLSVPFYRFGGVAALFLLPALGGLLTAAAMLRVVEELGLVSDRVVAVAALLVATPVGFYSLTFWEHTVALALATWSLALVLQGMGEAASGRRSLRLWVGAGVLLGLSAGLREEGLVWAGALGLGLLLVLRELRRPLLLALGGAIGLAPFWWLQWQWFGSPLGPHVSVYSGRLQGATAALERIASELGDLFFFLLRFHQGDVWSVVLAVPVVAAVAWATLRPAAPGSSGAGAPSRVDLWLVLAASVAAFAATVLLWREPRPIVGHLSRQGLLYGVPIVLLLVPFSKRLLLASDRRIRLLATASVVFAVVAPLPLHRADVGIIFGPRHYLVVLPALLALAAWVVARARSAGQPGLVRCAVLLLVLGLAIQARGVLDLAIKRWATQQLVDAVAGVDPSLELATDVYWLNEELAALSFRRPLRALRSDGDLEWLQQRLRELGQERMVVIVSPFFGALSPGRQQTLQEATTQRQVLPTGGLVQLQLEAWTVPTAARLPVR